MHYMNYALLRVIMPFRKTLKRISETQYIFRVLTPFSAFIITPFEKFFFRFKFCAITFIKVCIKKNGNCLKTFKETWHPCQDDRERSNVGHPDFRRLLED